MEQASKETAKETLSDIFSVKGMTSDMVRAILTHPNIAIVEEKGPDYGKPEPKEEVREPQ